MNLEGKRILIVEDNYDLARDLREEFARHGAIVLGPAPTPFYAGHLLGRHAPDGAVLDIRLHGTKVYELANRLTALGTPILFATGLEPAQMPPAFRAMPVLLKPYAPGEAVERLAELIARKSRPAFAAPPAPLRSDDVETRLMRAAARALRPASRLG